jgi:hypothetical protein
MDWFPKIMAERGAAIADALIDLPTLTALARQVGACIRAIWGA